MNKKSVIIGLIIAILIFLGGSYYIKNSTGSTRLTWDANKEPNIAGYKIYYGTESRTGNCPKGGYENKVDAGNKTDYIIEGLKRNTKYYFSITSYNSEGKESCFSDEVSKKVDIINWKFWKK